MAKFILKYLNIHSSSTINELKFLSQTISEFQSINNNTTSNGIRLETGNSFCYSYDEKLTLHKNAQKELSFKMNRYIIRDDRREENPFIHNIVVGTQLLLIDKYENQYLFTVSDISFTFKELNMTYEYKCSDSFSYQLSHQNITYSIENNSESEDYIGSQTIDWWVKEKINKDCHISYTYLGLNQELYLVEDINHNKGFEILCPEKLQSLKNTSIKKIKSIYTEPEYNETLPFSGSGTSNSILISLGEQLGLMLKTYEYMNDNGSFSMFYWFEPIKNKNTTGLKYSPYSDIQNFSLSHSGNSLATVLNVEGGTIDEETITLFPAIPTFFKKLFQDQIWLDSKYYSGYFTQICSNYNFNANSLSDGYKIWIPDDDNGHYDHFEILNDRLYLYIKKKTSNGYITTIDFSEKKLYNRIKLSINGKRSNISLPNGIVYNGDTKFTIGIKIGNEWIDSFEENKEIPEQYLKTSWSGLRISIPFSGSLTDVNFDIWINCYRDTSKEELLFAKIADACPWLENKLIDFSYYYKHNILNKAEYLNIVNMLQNDLRIINGRLMLHADEYYAAIHKKTKIISDLTNTIDNIGAQFQANILNPFINKNATLDTNSFLLALESLRKEVSNENNCINYDETLSDYVNKYINAEQRFLKNMYDFRKYFEEKINFFNGNLYKYTIEMPDFLSTGSTYAYGFDTPYYAKLTNQSGVTAKEFLSIPIYKKEDNIYNKLDNSLKVDNTIIANGNYYLANTSPSTMLFCTLNTSIENIHTTTYDDSIQYYEYYFTKECNSLPFGDENWTQYDIGASSTRYVFSHSVSGSCISGYSSNQALWQLEAIKEYGSSKYSLTAKNIYHFNTGDELNNNYTLKYGNDSLNGLTLNYTPVTITDMKENFLNNCFLNNASVANTESTIITSAYNKQKDNYYLVFDNQAIASNPRMNLPLLNEFYGNLSGMLTTDIISNLEAYDSMNEDQDSVVYFSNIPLNEIYMKSKNFIENNEIIYVSDDSKLSYQTIPFVNYSNFSNYYRRVRKSKKESISSIKKLTNKDYWKTIKNKADRQTGFDNKGKTKYIALSSNKKIGNKFNDYDSNFANNKNYFFINGDYTTFIQQNLNNEFVENNYYALVGRYFPQSAYTLLNNNLISIDSYEVVSDYVDIHINLEYLRGFYNGTRTNSAKYYYKTDFWRILNNNDFINNVDTYYILPADQIDTINSIYGKQYSFNTYGNIILNKIVYYPLDTILEDLRTALIENNNWLESDFSSVKKIGIIDALKDIFDTESVSTESVGNYIRFKIEKDNSTFKCYILKNEDYELSFPDLSGDNLENKLKAIQKLNTSLLFNLSDGCQLDLFKFSSFAVNLSVKQGKYSDFELITDSSIFNADTQYFYGEDKIPTCSLEQAIKQNKYYYSKSNYYVFNSQFSSSGTDHKRIVPINYYTRKDATSASWKLETTGYMEFDFNATGVSTSFNHTFIPKDSSVLVNNNVTGTYITKTIAIGNYSNGEYWYLYNNSSDSYLQEQAILIESNLESYWQQALTASKYCKYFIPDNWQKTVNGNLNYFADSIINIVIKLDAENNRTAKPILLNDFIPDIVIDSNSNKYKFNFNSIKNLETYSTNLETANILKSDFNNYNENLKYGNIVSLDQICNTDTKLYNSFLQEVFTNEKLKLNTNGIWTATQLYEMTYYKAISGGKTWNQILNLLTNNTISESSNFGGWYEMMLIALKNGNYKDYTPQEYENSLLEHNNQWYKIYRLYPSIIIEQSYKNEDALDSETLYNMSKLAFEDYKDIERQYNITMIDIKHLKGYIGQEIKIGDGIQIEADEYYDEFDEIKNSLQQYLFVTDESYSLRKDSDVSLTVNIVRYKDKIVKELLKLIR